MIKIAPIKKAPNWYTSKGLQLPELVQTILDANNRIPQGKSSVNSIYMQNGKKELAALNAPRLAAKPLSVTNSTISISDLLDYVNKYFPDVLPKSVYEHYGHTERPSGKIGESAKYSITPETDAEYMSEVEKGDT